MKVTVEVNDPDEWEVEALINYRHNQLKVETIWDEVFRPIIKYGDDPAKIKIAEEIWEKLRGHLARN